MRRWSAGGGDRNGPGVLRVNTTAVPPCLLDVRAGRAEPFGPQGEPSAIRKRSLAGRAAVVRAGLVVDEQADRRHHGGPDKALHHYPGEHYAAWRVELPEQAALLETGSFGENLVTRGMCEQDVCVGDAFRVGSVTVQVSQGRQPCWKLNVRFGRPDMARRVQDSGRAGWYYRVIEEGVIATGDTFALLERPHPEWTLARVQRLLYRDCLDREALAALSEVGALAPDWRELLCRRLGSGEVEDWSRRLHTPG